MPSQTQHKLPSTAWKPGVSGNPSGRPAIVRPIRELARKATVRSFNALVRNLTCGNPNAEVAAANSLLAYAWGKPDHKINIDISAIDALTPQARDALELLGQIIAAHAPQMIDAQARTVEGANDPHTDDKPK